jgi:two-component system LytT family response regulator
MIAELKPDIVFLDIKMPGGNTLDTIVKNLPPKTLVIFVTAYDEFALKAIKLGALDYLLKPVDPAELEAAGKKALEHFGLVQKLKNNNYNAAVKHTLLSIQQSALPALIGVYTNNEYVSLQPNDTIAFEAIGAYTRIYASGNREFVTSRNIGYYENLLQEMPVFYRVHKSFIINTSRISSVNKTDRIVKMNNDKDIPVSFRTMPQFISFLGR